jgi:hypothetical protein
MSTTFRAFAIGLPLFLLIHFSSTARADVLLDADFEQVEEGQVPLGPQPVGSITKWEGDAPGMHGKVQVTANPDSSGKSIQVSDSSPNESKAPSVQFTWPAPTSGALVVEWKVMVPVSGKYLCVSYLGGGWEDAAAILLLDNEAMTIQYGEKGARMKIGPYLPNQWYTVRFELDLVKRTFNFYLDGAKRANGLPFQTANKNVGRAAIYADYAAVDRAGEAVLRLDDVKVEKLDAMPKPTAATGGATGG